MTKPGEKPPPSEIDSEALAHQIGTVRHLTDWLLIDQPLVDAFARSTGDEAFIHVDPERAARTSFGGTIAHGFLTLSLLPMLMRTAVPQIRNQRLGLNYGFDRVRFLAPVPVGRRIRAAFTLAEVTWPKADFVRLIYDVKVEIEGSDTPAATVKWLVGRWIAPEAQPDAP